ncbi:MAG TPA: hypothetical protein PKI77_18390 [Mycobacterium sp.]|nr:hypothetical protein [Mycobacterium sp.]
MADQPYDDGSISDLPWGVVFDPIVNARALSAVQARGFRAAREVVDRLLAVAEGFDFPATGPGRDDTAAPDVDRVLGSWQKLLGQLGDTIRGTLVDGAAGPTAMFDLRTANVAGQVMLDTDTPGAVSTEFWLHNGGPEDMGKIRLRCSDLLADDGALIESGCVRFEPDMVAMPARSSRGVIIEVDVSEEDATGTYRGTLLADGHPDVWLPVTLVIRSEI